MVVEIGGIDYFVCFADVPPELNILEGHEEEFCEFVAENNSERLRVGSGYWTGLFFTIECI